LILSLASFIALSFSFVSLFSFFCPLFHELNQSEQLNCNASRMPRERTMRGTGEKEQRREE
jgi:hypothetical protein